MQNIICVRERLFWRVFLLLSVLLYQRLYETAPCRQRTSGVKGINDPLRNNVTEKRVKVTSLAALDASPLRACLTVRRSDRRRGRPVENYMACSHGTVAGTQPSSDSVDARAFVLRKYPRGISFWRVMVVSLRQKFVPWPHVNVTGPLRLPCVPSSHVPNIGMPTFHDQQAQNRVTLRLAPCTWNTLICKTTIAFLYLLLYYLFGILQYCCGIDYKGTINTLNTNYIFN